MPIRHNMIGITAIYLIYINRMNPEKTSTATAKIASDIVGMIRNKLTKEAKIFASGCGYTSKREKNNTCSCSGQTNQLRAIFEMN